jgi:hypothetical protein
MDNPTGGKVNCFQCVHFAVSWDPKHPRACRLFGFKSARLPSAGVREDSGFDCLGFEQKKPSAGKGAKNDRK